MNGRIDKLLVEAGAYFGGDGVVYDTFDPKKFAELMVQECYVALFPALRDMISRGQAYDMIRQHFGVDK
jgi:hypothetical protein